MDKKWMGRYSELVSALVMHGNVVSRGNATKTDIGDGIILSPPEWQTLCHLVQHQGENSSMIDVARFLGIPPSSFTRIVKTLKEYNLVERFQVAYNKKNIIIRATDYAIDLYSRIDNSKRKAMFEDFFRELDALPDEDLEIFTRALNQLTQHLPSYASFIEPELKKIE